MNIEQNPLNLSSLQEESRTNRIVKEVYHAPQIKIHGKLEKLTLQSSSIDPNGPGGGTEGGGV